MHTNEDWCLNMRENWQILDSYCTSLEKLKRRYLREDRHSKKGPRQFLLLDPKLA